MLLQSDFRKRIYPLYAYIRLSFPVLPNKNAFVAKGRKKSVTYTDLPFAYLPSLFVLLSLL